MIALRVFDTNTGKDSVGRRQGGGASKPAGCSGLAAQPAPLRREGALEIEVGEFELGLIGTPLRQGDIHPAHAAADQRADLHKLQADGADGGVVELGVRSAMRRTSFINT